MHPEACNRICYKLVYYLLLNCFYHDQMCFTCRLMSPDLQGDLKTPRSKYSKLQFQDLSSHAHVLRRLNYRYAFITQLHEFY